jgi:hypothetical protein
MYGMIHRAARAFAIERLGDAFWTEFSDSHGLTEAAFVSAQGYPDEVSFSVIAGLAMTMPGARMPDFFLLADTAEHLRLSYVSQRKGLEPFVTGLLKGLCGMFGVEADVILDSDASDVGVVFEIRYRAAAAA